MFARYRTRAGQKFEMSTDQTIEPSGRGLMARLGRCLRRFGRNRDGATAIEFTLLAIPFSMLVFAILESCISFAAQEIMTNATDDVARQLRTGQLLKANVNEITLKQAICEKMEFMVAKGCPDMIVDLREFPTFADAAAVKIKITTDKRNRHDRVRRQARRSTHQEHAQGLLPLAGDDGFHEQVDVGPRRGQDAAFRERHLAERTVRRVM